MTDTLTHARTLAQPLAWASASGHCPVIASDTRPGLEHVGRLIGIHAGLTRNAGPKPNALDTMAAHGVAWDDLPRGALIGVARLVGVVRMGTLGFVRMLGASLHESIPTELSDRIRPWWRGPRGWLLEEAVLLPEPIPMRGQQGLWRIQNGSWHGMKFDYHPFAAERALEQWRKARETR